MEKSVTEMLADFRRMFELPQVDLRTYSPLVLAYIGDGIYELIIRTILVGQGNAHANRMHQMASGLVKAAAQSAMAEQIMEELTEEELTVYKRGRNAHSGTMARHASMGDYRRATGFEALLGYLYLKEDWERMFYLVKLGLTKGELLWNRKH